MKLQKLFLIIILFIISANFTFAATIIYDNFQGQTLDPNKWTIEHARPPEAASCCFLDESHHLFHVYAQADGQMG